MAKRTILILFIAALVGLGGGTLVRARLEATAALSEGRELLSKNDPRGLLRLGDAVSWNFLLLSAGDEAEKLLSEYAFKEGPLQVRALMELKSGLLRSRSFLSPRGNNPHLVKNVEAALHRIDSRYTEPPLTDPRERDPYFFWSLLSCVLFFGWVGSVAHIIWHGFTPEGAWKGGLHRWIAGGCVSFAAWLIALRLS